MYSYRWNEGLIVDMVEANISDLHVAIDAGDADSLEKACHGLAQSITLLRLSKNMDVLIEVVEPVYDKAKRHLHGLFPAERDSHKGGVEVDLSHPNAEKIAQLGRHWFDQPTENEKAMILQHRVRLDPIDQVSGLPLTLIHRLAVNGIDIDAYQGLCERQKQWHKPLPPEAIEPLLMYPIQALQLLLRVCNKSQGAALNRVMGEGRLRLLKDDATAMSLCIATSQGCYMQLACRKGLVDFYDLVHEFGHCLHFGHDLDVWLKTTSLQQEAAAINFEIRVLQRLRHTDLPMDLHQRSSIKSMVANIAKLRRAYYRQWLWRVHRFELALYQHGIGSVDELHELWHECTEQAPAEYDWRTQSHLYVAPFMLVNYPYIASGAKVP